MKARSQPKFLLKKGIAIDRLWEVRLSPEHWQKVQKVAAARKTTYSWVVRYCVFRLVKHTRLRMFPVMENRINEIKEKYPRSGECHRHMLCLYGEDEKLLRMAAFNLGITVSMLIRLALDWFLPRFFDAMKRRDWVAKGRQFAVFARIDKKHLPMRAAYRLFRRYLRMVHAFRWRDFAKIDDFFWFGIKLCKAIEPETAVDHGLPFYATVFYRKFRVEDWFETWKGGWDEPPIAFSL